MKLDLQNITETLILIKNPSGGQTKRQLTWGLLLCWVRINRRLFFAIGCASFRRNSIRLLSFISASEISLGLRAGLDGYKYQHSSKPCTLAVMASQTKSYLCDMTLTNRDIEAIQHYFQDKPVLKAFLFGSFSRKEASKDSDIDILVELDYSKHIGMTFVTMKYDLEERLHKKIDLISSNAVSKHILPFINVDKRLIYER